PRAWVDLDARRHFDYLLWRRSGYGSERLLDRFDADSAFALVFLDDAAALYVRRDGILAPIAAAFQYRAIAAGPAKWHTLGIAASADTALRNTIIRELERESASSPEHALAELRLGGAAL